ncbi:MAG: hypothetical protein IPH51_17965 [Rubrivivax sp.]|nr:hypothetical protein [Rubrivivax sp.]
MLVDAHRAEEQRHQAVRFDEDHAAVLVAPRQHPVQQVASGDEVDADQPCARHADGRRGADTVAQAVSVAPMSPTSWPDSSTDGDLRRAGGFLEAGDSMKLVVVAWPATEAAAGAWTRTSR